MEPIRIATAMRRSLETRPIELDERIAGLRDQTEGNGTPDESALLDQLERERDDIATAVAHAILIDNEPFDTEAIEIGDTITIQADDGHPETYVLVEGMFGARVHEDWVSISSSVGAALLGRSKGERIVVESPVGSTAYTILSFERGSHKGSRQQRSKDLRPETADQRDPPTEGSAHSERPRGFISRSIRRRRCPPSGRLLSPASTWSRSETRRRAERRLLAELDSVRSGRWVEVR